MHIGITILNQNIKTIQNYFIWILTPLLFILKLKIFVKILQVMFKKDLIHQIMKIIINCLQERN